MALLAKSPATIRVRVAFVVVHVRDCQHHLATGLGVRLTIRRPALGALRRAFATVRGAEEDEGAKRAPLFRMDRPPGISFHLFRLDRHRLSTSRNAGIGGGSAI